MAPLSAALNRAVASFSLNSSGVVFSMGKKSRRQNLKPPGTCVFCRRSPPDIKMSKEHIWSDWLQQIIPDYGGRFEGYTTNANTAPHTYESKQGAVHKKRVRVVCEDCNNGWMSKIVEGAKPFAKKLAMGEATDLDASSQTALANWIGLAALIANRLTKSDHKLPKSDFEHFYEHHRAPAHWFVGIGSFAGTPSVCFNHAPSAVREMNGQTKGSVAFVKHAFASVIGALYTIVDVEIDFSGNYPPPFGGVPAGDIYRPQIVSLQPTFAEKLRFPFLQRISGGIGPAHFFPGTQAYEVARRAATFFSEGMQRAGVPPIR
jgi:hypothetical protein